MINMMTSLIGKRSHAILQPSKRQLSPSSASMGFAIPGGIPIVGVDVPVCAVFIALYALLAAGHMTTFQINRIRRHHKFVYSAVLFGFCMSRIATCSMRIAWALHPTNTGVVVAAEILVNAGILLLYIVNLVFAQRILRAAHPAVGWSRAVYFAYTALFVLVPLCLVGVITTFILNLNTTSLATLADDRHVQMTAIAVLLCTSFLPLPIILLTVAIPSPKSGREDFGSGSWAAKVAIALFGTTLICFGAGFRGALILRSPVPAANPEWFDARWCFYVFNFSIEVVVVGLYLVSRVDRRFWVPDGSRRAGDYYMLSK